MLVIEFYLVIKNTNYQEIKIDNLFIWDVLALELSMTQKE